MTFEFFYRKGESFNAALFVILLSIYFVALAFLTENNKVGLAASNLNSHSSVSEPKLIEFQDFNSLSSLASGEYYIDNNGKVYWTDDESRPMVAKVKLLSNLQKNRYVYVDKNGKIGYVIH